MLSAVLHAPDAVRMEQREDPRILALTDAIILVTTRIRQSRVVTAAG